MTGITVDGGGVEHRISVPIARLWLDKFYQGKTHTILEILDSDSSLAMDAISVATTEGGQRKEKIQCRFSRFKGMNSLDGSHLIIHFELAMSYSISLKLF
ncbi:hypothetical protein AX16_003833 [Volvariella volvacea WC 439]|nr:hypothetical protein AX16_003833 [Volvariella volvacea WC 439]